MLANFVTIQGVNDKKECENLFEFNLVVFQLSLWSKMQFIVQMAKPRSVSRRTMYNCTSDDDYSCSACLPCLPCLPGCLPVWLPGCPPPRWQEGASLHLLHCNQSNHSRLAGLSSTPISQHASAGHDFSASSLSALVISPISRHAWFSQISPSEQ